MTRAKWGVAGLTGLVVALGVAASLWYGVPSLRAESDGGEAAANGEAWLGVVAVPISENAAAFLGIPKGLRVVALASEGPARDRVIRGDTITAIDGFPLTDLRDLTREIAARGPGATVSLSLVRGGAPLEVELVLAARPDAAEHPGGLAGLQEAFDRALSGQLVFETAGGETRTVAFVTGSVVAVDGASITVAPADGSAERAYPLSPNAWVWMDGAPVAAGQYAGLVGARAKVATVDGVADAVVAGSLFPPVLEALGGLFGGGDPDGAGGLGALRGLFEGVDSGATFQ